MHTWLVLKSKEDASVTTQLSLCDVFTQISFILTQRNNLLLYNYDFSRRILQFSWTICTMTAQSLVSGFLRQPQGWDMRGNTTRCKSSTKRTRATIRFHCNDPVFAWYIRVFIYNSEIRLRETIHHCFLINTNLLPSFLKWGPVTSGISWLEALLSGLLYYCGCASSAEEFLLFVCFVVSIHAPLCWGVVFTSLCLCITHSALHG